jgi:hypothetical protein
MRIGNMTHGFHGGKNIGVIKTIIMRIVSVYYWFYKNIIKERNDGMKLYYSIFLFSMTIAFYLVTILLYLLIYVHSVFILRLSNRVILFLGISILSFSFNYLFLRKHEGVIKKMSEKVKFSLFEVFVIIFTLGAFVSLFLFNLTRFD